MGAPDDPNPHAPDDRGRMGAPDDQDRTPAPDHRRTNHRFHRTEGRGSRRRHADRSSADHHHDQERGGRDGRRSVRRYRRGPVARHGSQRHRTARPRARRCAYLVPGRSVRIHQNCDPQRLPRFDPRRRICPLDLTDGVHRNRSSARSNVPPTASLPLHPNRARRTAAAAIPRCRSPVVATPHQARPTWFVTSCLRQHASDPKAGPVETQAVRCPASRHDHRPHRTPAPDAPGLPRTHAAGPGQTRDQAKNGAGPHSDAVPRSWDGEDVEKT